MNVTLDFARAPTRASAAPRSRRILDAIASVSDGPAISAPSASSPAISIIFGPHTERYIGIRRSTECTRYPPDRSYLNLFPRDQIPQAQQASP